VTGVALAVALLHRQSASERDRGEKLLAEVGELFLRGGYGVSELPIVNVYLAREMARRGELDDAIPVIRAAVDDMVHEGQLLGWGVPATGVLVETLLDRGDEADVVEAEAAIDRLASPQTEGVVARVDIWLTRLRALLARARGDVTAYSELVDRYRDMAETLGFEGHIDWAAAMR
ncbi:MAG: cyclase, partial [Mycobacteriaceae bacterium]|nr:cyclase [Mycobacteriaceae bacterium]